jgi:hypothetical protein
VISLVRQVCHMATRTSTVFSLSLIQCYIVPFLSRANVMKTQHVVKTQYFCGMLQTHLNNSGIVLYGHSF